jgi:hypothetical protein
MCIYYNLRDKKLSSHFRSCVATVPIVLNVFSIFNEECVYYVYYNHSWEDWFTKFESFVDILRCQLAKVSKNGYSETDFQWKHGIRTQDP